MSRTKKTDIKIVIFAKSHRDRDRLRNNLSMRNATFLYFEEEAICFDNLDSIRPDVVVIRSDSKDIVRRFVFASRTLQLATSLLVVSDVLVSENFEFEESTHFACSIKKKRFSDGLNDIIQQMVSNGTDHGGYVEHSLLIGESAAIKKIRAVIPVIQRSGDPILITGEPGTGKRLIANLLAGPAYPEYLLIKLDCADKSQQDCVKRLHFNIPKYVDEKVSVTVLIIHIEKAGSRLQSEILALLDRNDHPQVRQGADEFFNFRLIATSSEDLECLVRQGGFRQDLFFRLNVIPLEVPPLRDRKEDIASLSDFFMLRSRRQLNRSFIIPSLEMKQQLCFYDWPGNVDALQKAIHRVAITGDEASVMPDTFLPNPECAPTECFKKLYQHAVLPDVNEIKGELKDADQLPLKAICEKFISRIEKNIMQRALEYTNWNRKKAAALLNISYKSMLNKIKMYEII